MGVAESAQGLLCNPLLQAVRGPTLELAARAWGFCNSLQDALCRIDLVHVVFRCQGSEVGVVLH